MQLSDRAGRRPDPEQRSCRIARHEVDHEEDQHRHPEHGRDGLEEAARDEAAAAAAQAERG
jgi:hypothetical protein